MGSSALGNAAWEAKAARARSLSRWPGRQMALVFEVLELSAPDVEAAEGELEREKQDY